MYLHVEHLSKMTPAQERQFWEQFERDLDRDTGEAAKAHLAAGRPKPALSPVTLPTLTFSVTGIPLHYRHYPHVPRVEVRHVSGQASTFKFLAGQRSDTCSCCGTSRTPSHDSRAEFS